MLPFHPPLPTAWNLPFQPAAGSHTSILMSDSFVGVSVAATRQNAGRSAKALAPPRPPGWVNAPAATGCAIVTVPLVSFAVARLSHVAADAGPAAATRAIRPPTATRAECSVRERISCLPTPNSQLPTTNHQPASLIYHISPVL